MQNYDMAKAAIDASLEKTGLEYLDLYLLHQAMKDYFSVWRAMEDAYREGKLKAIGVSNFYPNILTNFCETVEICPMVNQEELHPYFTQEDSRLKRECDMNPFTFSYLPKACFGKGALNRHLERNGISLVKLDALPEYYVIGCGHSGAGGIFAWKELCAGRN